MAARWKAERHFRLLVEGVTDLRHLHARARTGGSQAGTPGAARIKGYTAGRESSANIFPASTRRRTSTPACRRTALATARRDGRYEAEGWRCRKDGSRFWAGVVIDAIYDEGDFVGFAKITRDLTERREAQLQLDQSRELLFQMQKMEAVGQLTGGSGA